MKRRITIPILLITLLVSYLLFGSVLSPPVSRGKMAKATKGPLAVWSAYEGRLEARRVVIIMSKFKGNATVIELAQEGVKVSKGDVLVRFDSSALEREVLKLERDYALAKSELDSLKHASIPLDLRDLEMKLLETRTNLSAEKQYLDASIQLAKEGLVSEPEIAQQKLKVEEITTQLETLELEMQLTREYLHPSALKRTQAKLLSAEQELKLAREQLQNSVVLSPTDGVVAYKPVYIGTEFRIIRIGDSVYPNQPFMVLPNMDDLVVHCEIPEEELSRIQEGKDVFIQSLAYPDVRLRGVVETVGSMAQNLPGQAGWQKFFHAVISLKEVDLRLRPGMSVTTHILSYYNPNAVLIPRTAVRWKTGKPFGKVVTGSSQETRQFKLGMGNEENYEVIEGLNPGEEVLIE